MRLWVLTVSFGRSPLSQCQWRVGVPPSYCPMGARPLGQVEEGLHSMCMAEAQPSRCLAGLPLSWALGALSVSVFPRGWLLQPRTHTESRKSKEYFAMLFFTS